jgi:hypothetical protein
MKKHLRSLIILLFGLGLSIASNVVLAIYGWGLTPKNWWVIGPGYLGMVLLAQLFLKLANTEEI